MTEAVLLIGLPGAGKSTFYLERFFHSHLRINLDQLRTRHREHAFVELCLTTGLRFVVDNTNPSRAERAVYLEAARRWGFRTVGYVFEPDIAACRARNARRGGRRRVPEQALVARSRVWQRPTSAEGFDRLYRVTAMAGGFWTEPYRDDPDGAALSHGVRVPEGSSFPT